MKISVSNSAFGVLAQLPVEYVRVAENTRFRHLDFSTATGIDRDDYEELYASAKREADAHGIDFPMVHAPYKFNPCIDEDNFKMQVSQMKRAFKACKILGVDRMTVHSGYGYSECREEMMEKNIRYYNAILPFAEENNVMIMIENIAEEIYRRPFVIETAENILELKHALNDHPLIKACWDTGHANVKALDQYDNIIKLKGMLEGVHLQDNNGYNDDHMPILAGTVNFDEVMQGLIDINYDGPFNMETHFFNGGRAWPNFRRDFTEKSHAQRLLYDPDEKLKYISVDLMYTLAEYVLNKYNIDIE